MAITVPARSAKGIARSESRSARLSGRSAKTQKKKGEGERAEPREQGCSKYPGRVVGECGERVISRHVCENEAYAVVAIDLQLSAKRNIDELKVDVISQHRCDNASSRIMRRGFSAMTFRIIELHGFRN